jgi:deoxyhypusine synthase
MEGVMSQKFKPIDLKQIKTYPLSARKNIVGSADFAKTCQKGSSFKNFLRGLPNILAGADIRTVISTIAKATRNKKTIIFGIGAHVIKVGLNPVVIDLMERGVTSCVAMNGAGIIHDLEIAMAGQTSEDVAKSIANGSFGMAQETCAFVSQALAESTENSAGLGESVGRAIYRKKLPFSDKSILATGFRLGVPVTIHVAIGTDIIHMHPQFDPGQTGVATHKDFRMFASIVATLQNGVYLNMGSAVILPEIFLKAVSLARNLGHTLDNFMTVNMDFIHQYRSMTNVVRRPTAKGGKGINLVGHHEIMLPLLAAGIIEELD